MKYTKVSLHSVLDALSLTSLLYTSVVPPIGRRLPNQKKLGKMYLASFPT